MGNSIKDILKKPSLLFMTLGHRGFFNWMKDETYLKISYRIKMGRNLNLENPQTFNEKLQWLKLHDRRPEYTMMVDKYEVKKYVEDRIGAQYVIPTIGVWDRFDQIDFDTLPDRFVLKCTHDSGGLVICKDKASLDKKRAKKKIEKCLRHNFFWGQREWPYKNVKPRIIAEPYLEDESGSLPDFTVHNYNSVPRVILVCKDRFSELGLTEDFYTDKWEHIKVSRPDHPNAKEIEKKSAELEEMLELSKALSKKCPFIRSDFYTINHHIYFGELTLYPASGFKGFIPDEYDNIMGDWIILPIRGGVILHKKNMYILIDSSKMPDDGLQDYKFFTFNGEVKALFIASQRWSKEETKFDFFDQSGKRLPFENGHPRSTISPLLPQRFEEMKRLASILGKGIPEVRVDFYEVNGKVLFGEMTFYHWSGMVPFVPEKWDYTFGSWINLDSIK